MDKISQYRSRSSSDQRKPNGKRNHIIERNKKKLNERKRGAKGIRKGQ